MSHLAAKGVGGTRFIALSVIFLTSCGFLWWGKLDAGEWVELIKWVFLTYAGSEGVAKSAQAYKDKSQ